MAAFGIAWLLSAFLANAGSRLLIVDYPNSRSLHTKPVPRTGGLAVLAGILVGGGVWIGAGDAPIVLAVGLGAGLSPLALVSVLDDRYGIAAKLRLMIHCWAAISLSVAGLVPGRLDLPGLSLPLSAGLGIPLTVLFTVWMINLYNFMDGMDGFAGGMAVIGFTTLAWLGRVDIGFSTFCLVVAAASAGFLLHNFPPAKLFLGDSGSTTLGFLAAACSLWGSQAGLFPFWTALLIFSPFIVDATVTLLRRLWHGEPVWKAHRSHYYQRLVLLGWGHRRTVLVEYALMLACAASALLAIQLPPADQTVLAGVWIVIYGLLMMAVAWLERRPMTGSA